MSYAFAGALLIGDGTSAAADDLIAKLGGVARSFSEPTAGVAVAFAADHDFSRGHATREGAPNVEALRTWSANHPDLRLIALHVECFGGLCDQWGAALRAGRVLLSIPEPVQDDGVASPLIRLFEAVGVPGARAAFAPLERGYFPPRRSQ